MEAHIISIARLVVCFLSLIIAITAMVKANENNAMRRLSAVLAAVIIYFNNEIGKCFYLLVGSTIEAAIATAGVGFILVLLVVIVFLPLIVVIRKLTH